MVLFNATILLLSTCRDINTCQNELIFFFFSVYMNEFYPGSFLYVEDLLHRWHWGMEYLNRKSF